MLSTLPKRALSSAQAQKIKQNKKKARAWMGAITQNIVLRLVIGRKKLKTYSAKSFVSPREQQGEFLSAHLFAQHRTLS